MRDTQGFRWVSASSNRPRLTLPVVLALALVLLCSAFIQYTAVTETKVIAPARPDAASYVSYAYNLREYGVYSRAHTWLTPTLAPPVADDVSPPGYPLFLSIFLTDKPDVHFMHRVTLAQAILGVISTLFVFLLAARVLAPSLACAVALLTALTPHLATISTYLLTESLFTCLLLISMWAFVRAVQSSRYHDWAMAGLVFGLCCLVRPTLQIAPLLLLLFACFAPRMRPFLKPLALATVCWAVLLAPWVAYKSQIPDAPDQPNLVRATIYHGSFPKFMYQDRPETYAYAYRYDPQATEIMGSGSALRKRLGERMRQQPWRYLHWYLIGKPEHFLSWGMIDGFDIYIYPVSTSPFMERPSFKTIRGLLFALHWPLMLFGVGAAITALWRPHALQLQGHAKTGAQAVAIVFLIAIGLHMIGAPYPRYGIPFRPLAYVLAALSAAALWQRLARRIRANQPSNLSAPAEIAHGD
jgi:4-amino-4-deoxy-L-arabinose transferase-like glycosyltransferase